MPEFYTITTDKQFISFTARPGDAPEYALSPTFDPKTAPAGLAVVCRMGAPDVAHCVIFRFDDKPGGVFAMHDSDGFLFAAVAETNLAYALAKGFFGRLTATARYGVDVFEHLEDDND